VDVTASLIAGNQTANGSGGGLCVSGTLTLTDSTVQGNFATDGGGGMRVLLTPAAATVINSTFSGNSINAIGAAGAAIESQSVLTITNSTISACSGAASPRARTLVARAALRVAGVARFPSALIDSGRPI
jgi:hypothetical protein